MRFSSNRIMRVTVLISFLAQFGCGAKLLAFFPFPWRSHNHVFQPLMKALALRGHEVHFYTALPVKDPPKGLIQYPLKDQHDEVLATLDLNDLETNTPFQTQRLTSIVGLGIVEKSFTLEKSCLDLLNSTTTFDAVLTEFPLGGEALAYLAPKFKALSILVMALHDHPWFNEVSGLPDNPSYMVNPMIVPASNTMTFGERLYNTYFWLSTISAGYLETMTRQQEFADKYIRYEGWEKRPPLSKIISDNALILMNSHVSTAHSYPKAPHVKEVGGLHINPSNQPLPKDLQDFMDDAPNGVIYFSLGSIVKPEMLVEIGKFDVFVNVFKKLKQKVLWKTAAGMPPVDDPKIRVQTWFPQQGILAHKNTKMFITHGGLQSTIEAISNGVPCLGTPVIFDQEKDIIFLQSVGMARMLKFDNVTEETLSWAINEILNNPSYKERAMKQKDLFFDRPRRPLDEAVYWIEYVIKHGKILQPASTQMPIYQLYMLDVMAFLILASVLAIIITKAIFRFIASFFYAPSKKNVKHKIN